jgi:hypothetical protein
MSASELSNSILPALLTGVRGRVLPQPYGATDSLQVLALAAQAMKFEKPHPPEAFIIEEHVADTRKIVPEVIRPLLMEFIATGATLGAVGRIRMAIARVLANNGLKLHPFDLPSAETFVEEYKEFLGVEAQAFAQRNAAPEQRVNYFAAETMNDETWLLGNRGERASYIAERRQQDPEAALRLVEDAWSTFDVEGKVRLVRALRVQSNPGDVPFLRTLLKERSPRIKDAARAMLARLPGYDGDNPNLREALSRIEPRKNNPGAFSLQVPTNVYNYNTNEWIVSTFAGFGIEELARAKNLSVHELLHSAVPDERLLCGLMVSATNDGRFDIIEMITEKYLPTKKDFLFQHPIPGVERLTADEREEWLRAAVKPAQWTDIPVWMLTSIHDLLEGHMPRDVAEAIFNAPVTKRMLGTDGRSGFTPDHFELLAIMCPADLRARYVAMCALYPHAASAIKFLEILNSLENQNG